MARAIPVTALHLILVSARPQLPELQRHRDSGGRIVTHRAEQILLQTNSGEQALPGGMPEKSLFVSAAKAWMDHLLTDDIPDTLRPGGSPGINLCDRAADSSFPLASGPLL